jgi:hypothetical protein
MIDEHAAHRTSGHGEEVAPIVPGDVVQAESQVRLVYQGCRVEGMAASLTFELMTGDGLEFSVNEGKQIVGRLPLTSRNLPEQSCDAVVSHTPRSSHSRMAAP